MGKAIQRRKIKGVEFVVDEDGKKTAVLIDLRRHRGLWEDFYDSALANARRDEPRESVEAVKRKVFRRNNFTLSHSPINNGV